MSALCRAFSYGLLLSLLVSLTSGCGQPEIEGVPDYAETIAESILQAYNSGDYLAYSQHFDDTLKQAISQSVFMGTRNYYKNRIGEYKSKKITGVETKGIYTAVTYKAKFSEEPDDVTVSITFWEKDGEAFVSDLWFNSPKLREF